jgi:peptidoglycan/LPS O-acetylase OafA/YrhL
MRNSGGAAVSEPPERFYSLDALRGLAALSVVFWHWQHFFFSGTALGAYDLARLPLSRLLHLLYTQGWEAVDLFFSLSGFIFYWLYSKRVAGRRISAGHFSLLRFSRLYPLHLLTLLLVALGQYWMLRERGSYFVYPDNDALYFVLNLLFASSWGFEGDFSFNGPSWSVSVEVLLYALFFAYCRLLPIRAVILALSSLLGFFVIETYDLEVGRGVCSFFAGGCAFLAYQAIIASRRVGTLTRWLVGAAVGAWALTFIARHVAGFELRAHPGLRREIFDVMLMWPVMVLFPLTILALALAETRRGTLGKRISFLGDISYSSYLLHFPLQFVFFVVITSFTVDRSIFYSGWFMLLFFLVLLAISFCSFRYFELPAQRLLRRQRN